MNSTFETEILLATPSFLSDNAKIVDDGDIETQSVTPRELTQVGTLETNDAALAVAKIKPNNEISLPPDDFGLVLDDIRDPGNLGTILRIADWYGINNIIISNDSVDVYNPKVVNASMGSFLRVNTYYTLLEKFLEETDHPVLGTAMEGESAHGFNFGKSGWILLGNESSGIRPELMKHLSSVISIPSYGNAESLNVAVATAVICDNLRRKGH